MHMCHSGAASGWRTLGLGTPEHRAQHFQVQTNAEEVMAKSQPNSQEGVKCQKKEIANPTIGMQSPPVARTGVRVV